MEEITVEEVDTAIKVLSSISIQITNPEGAKVCQAGLLIANCFRELRDNVKNHSSPNTPTDPPLE